jgi:hypothetical protein
MPMILEPATYRGFTLRFDMSDPHVQPWIHILEPGEPIHRGICSLPRLAYLARSIEEAFAWIDAHQIRGLLTSLA